MPSDDETHVGLRSYIDNQIAHLRDQSDRHWEQSDRSLQQALLSINERLAGMNEFRGALRDQAALMATRQELEKISYELTRRLSIVENELSENRGKALTVGASWGAATAAVVSIIVGIVIRLAVP
jgi:hypothetical protein